MREYFRGWRRKSGMLMLVMACGVFGMWMRSYVVMEGLDIPDRQFQYAVFSANGGVNWATIAPLPIASRLPHIQWSSMTPTAVPFDVWSMHEIKWRRRYLGFDLGVAMETRNNWQFDFIVIPYWFIILPLTLLSAYLILWKPWDQRKTSAQLANSSVESN